MMGDFLRKLFEPGQVFEVRVPKCLDRIGADYRSTTAGYFNYESIDAACKAIQKLDASRRAPSIYVTLNPVNPALLARSANTLKSKVKATACDADIVARRHLLIDCDPVRPADVSSTNAELALAAAKADDIAGYLTSLGWSPPISIMSGNGHHLVYRIDLPRDDGGLVKRVLEGLASKFDDENVKIDRSVFNAARITKIPGTMARKGDHLVGVPGVEDRPHRRAELLSVPDTMIAVAPTLLEVVAIMNTDANSSAETRPPPLKPTAHGNFARFEHTPTGVRGYLEAHGVKVLKERAKGDSTMLDLAFCPVTGVEANGTEISVMITQSGQIAFRNLHNRGTGFEWLDVRDALEPGYKQHALAMRDRQAPPAVTTQNPSIIVTDVWDRPQRLQPLAFPLPLKSVFPASLGAIHEYALATSEAIQVPPDVLCMLMHPIVGLGMSQVVCVELTESWRQFPVHYNAALMEPANRKTDPYKELMRPVDLWESEAVEAARPKIAAQHIEISTTKRRIERLMDLASGKVTPRRGLDEPTGDAAKHEAILLQEELSQTKLLGEPQLVTGDITPEALARLLAANNERLGVFSDESETIDIMMGRYNDQPNFQLYNKAYDGSPHRINRASSSTILLRRPLLNIGFIIQPEAVRDLLSNRKAKGTGMIARFGMALPDSWLGNRKINPHGISPVLRAAWSRVVYKWLNEKIPDDGKLQVVPLSEKARGVFDEFRGQIEKDLGWCGEFNAYGFQDWGGKLCGKIGRTALTLHGMEYGVGAIDSITTPISFNTMAAAIEWAPYLIEHMKAVMSFIGMDENFVTAKRILAWVARTNLNEFSVKDCFDHIRNVHITTVDQLGPALNVLVERQFIRLIPRTLPLTRGRPASTEFQVNPLWDRGSP